MGKVIALDPSSSNVGWATFLDGEYMNSGVFTPSGKTEQRVFKIFQWVNDTVRMWNYRDSDTTVVIEEPAGSHKNAKTDRLLARVGGIIESVMWMNGWRVARVWPSQVKATGVCKDHLDAAAAIAGRGVGPDEADAIGVGLAYFAQVKKGD